MIVRSFQFGTLGLTAIAFVLACSSNDDGGTGSTAGTNSGGTATAGTGTGGGASGSGTGGSAVGGSSASGSSAGGSTATGGGGASSGSGGGGTTSGGSGGGGTGIGGEKSKTTFFVTSDTRTTGKLGPLETSDKRCQDLAEAAGIGDHKFHAYLSTSTVNAKDRIGAGPWHNSAGVLLAEDLASLHSANLKGDHTLFIDEKGLEIDGQWNGGAPNEHDILTGSNADGTAAEATCKDWTSDSPNDKGQVGHSDGMGPNKATTGTYPSWNSAHPGGSCADTTVAGGKGRIYCFAID
jgi:hypothetical protein